MAPERIGPLWWQQAEELFERIQQHCEQAVSLAQASASHAAEAKRLAETVTILVKGHVPVPEKAVTGHLGKEGSDRA